MVLSDQLCRKNSVFSVKKEKNSVILKKNNKEENNKNYLGSNYRKQENSNTSNTSTNKNYSSNNLNENNFNDKDDFKISQTDNSNILQLDFDNDEYKIIPFPRLDIKIINKNKNKKEKETIEDFNITPNSINNTIKDINKKVYFGGKKDVFPNKLIVEFKEKQRSKPLFNIFYDKGKNLIIKIKKIIRKIKIYFKSFQKFKRFIC